jgi:hypothetical protein
MVSVLSIIRQLLGTLVVVLGGWIAGVLSIAVVAYTGIGGSQRDSAFERTLFTSVAMWIFILPVWLVVLIPLYLFVPVSSLLWKPSVCTALGAVGGLASVAVYTDAAFDYYVTSFYVVSAIVGAATCFTGAVTHHYFKRPQTI